MQAGSCKSQHQLKRVRVVKVIDMSNRSTLLKAGCLKTQWSHGHEKPRRAAGRKSGSTRLHNFLKSEEKFGKLSALSQKVSAQITQYFYLPKLGNNTKMWSLPFTLSNSHQMLMPLDSRTATVPPKSFLSRGQAYGAH